VLKKELSEVTDVAVDKAFDLAKRVHAIDHGSEPYEPRFGSHPVIGQLFEHGGRQLTHRTKNGVDHTGRLIRVHDCDPNVAGSEPTIELKTRQGVTKLSLAAADELIVGGKAVYSAHADGPVLPRRFAASPSQVWVGDVFRGLDALHSDNVSATALDTIVALTISGTDAPKKESVEHEAAALLRTRPPQFAARNTSRPDLVEALLSLPQEEPDPVGTKSVKTALRGALVAEAALALLDQDVGPERKSAAALNAAAAMVGLGYNWWAFLFEDYVSDPTIVAAAQRATGHADIDTYGILRHGPDEARRAVLQGMFDAIPQTLMHKLKKVDAVDARLKPAIEAICGRATAAELRFTDAKSIEHAATAARSDARSLQSPYRNWL
jgi:hypothetical protein